MAVEKINPEIANTPEYWKWLDDALNQIKFHVRSCLKPLKATRSNEDLHWLTRHIQVTLFCAERYRRGDDRLVENSNERLKNMESQLKSISQFAKLTDKDPGFELRFFLDACYPFNIPDEDRRALIWKTGFSNYKKALEKEMEWIRKAKKRMLIAQGGLLYGEFNADGKKAKIQKNELNSKLFHLTYIFRHFTAGKLNLGTTVKKMPRFGYPRYDLTAKILNGKLTELDVRKYINRLEAKDVYIGHWPPSL